MVLSTYYPTFRLSRKRLRLWLIGPIVQHPSSIMTMNAPLARALLPNASLTVSILVKSLIV